MTKKKKRDKPRFKLIEEYEAQFKKDFSVAIGNVLQELTDKITNGK